MSDLSDPPAAAHAERAQPRSTDRSRMRLPPRRRETSSPQMMSGLAAPRLLEALIVVGGAHHVLEIGTFTGVGTLAMLAALPSGGRITPLERVEATAAMAREHFNASRLADCIELLVGDAPADAERCRRAFRSRLHRRLEADYPALLNPVPPK